MSDEKHEAEDKQTVVTLITDWLKPTQKQDMNVPCECGSKDWYFEVREDCRWLECEHCGKKRFVGSL